MASDLQKSDVESLQDVGVIVLGVGCANRRLENSRQIVEEESLCRFSQVLSTTDIQTQVRAQQWQLNDAVSQQRQLVSPTSYIMLGTGTARERAAAEFTFTV